MSVTRVDSVEEAVLAARHLLAANPRIWFRGQTKNWPLCSSLLRKSHEDREEAATKMNRYVGWLQSTPGLESLAATPDSAIGVAQHYSMPTNFIDFTRSPEVAAFFASENAGPDTAKDEACILFIDFQELHEFWKCMPAKYPPPEFLELDVPDLWRLQAQQGAFLYCPYDHFEKIFNLDRIVFPNTHPYSGLSREEVYPVRKSHLEVLLDQFFMNEQMIDFAENWKPPAGVAVINFTAPEGGCDPDVFPRGIPIHPSWSTQTLQPWLQVEPERLESALRPAQISLHAESGGSPRDTVAHLANQVLLSIHKLPDIRNRLVEFQVGVDGDSIDVEVASSFLPPRVARLWDGLRRLPYSDQDLSHGIGMCVALGLAGRGRFDGSDPTSRRQAARLCMVDAIETEFGALDGSYSRGFVSGPGLVSAVRCDLGIHSSPKWSEDISKNPFGVLQTVWNPRMAYDYHKLSTLFARELAPFQVLCRDAAVFYSPARLDKMGLP